MNYFRSLSREVWPLGELTPSVAVFAFQEGLDGGGGLVFTIH